MTYRNSKRDQTYLHIEKRDDFSRVSEELMKGFSQPTLAIMLPLDSHKRLVNADLEKVKQTLTEQGYYLQIPPPPEDLFKQYLAATKQDTPGDKRQTASGSSTPHRYST